MDDLHMIGALLAKPGPSPEVTARGRDRLLAAARGPARKRRFAWPVAALGAVAAATATIVVVSDLTPTATPNGPPPPAAASGRQVLLAAATTAEALPAGSGTYWHVKTVYRDSRSSESRESWTRRDGRQYVRNRSGRPTLIGGATTTFSVAGNDMTFTRIQRLPTRPAALKAEITGLLGKEKLPPNVKVVGLGRNPRLVQSLVDLLSRVPAPPKVRAAAFRVIAGLPGVSRAGQTAEGQTLLIRSDGGDVRLIVDPATSVVRGWTATPPPVRKRGGAWLADQSVSFPVAEWTSRLS